MDTMASTLKSNEDAHLSGNPSGLASSAAKAHALSLSALGDACGVAFLLGNHAKFGLAERCCYHFDLIETLTSLPERAHQARARGRDRGDSVSSDGQESNITGEKSPTAYLHGTSSSDSSKFCSCGVVSLLECVPSTTGDSRPYKRALRSKHREFNTRAQKSWGRAHRGSIAAKKHNRTSGNPGEHCTGARHCHQPRHLPLPLNPSTRVTFAYEITSIAIVIDASPSVTAATFVNESFASTDELCIPLDRLAPMLKVYLKGLVQPIEVPPVSCSGVGVALGRWTPNLAITVVAAFPPTSRGDRGSAGLLVRDYRVTEEQSAMELVRHVESWALNDVEGMIADRLCGEKSHIGDGLGGRKSQGVSSQLNPVPISKISSWTSVRSSMKDILAVGDAALATLPPEGRPAILVASDCLNVHCGGVFDYLADTSRSDVPISVLHLSNVAPSSNLTACVSHPSLPLSVSDDSKPLRDACAQSGGVFLDVNALDFYTTMTAGSPISSPPYVDTHFVSKRRSIRPNALQWYSLFSLSPLTPGYVSQPLPRPIVNSFTGSAIFSSTGSVSSKQHRVQDSLSTFGGMTKLSSNHSFESSKHLGHMEVSFSTQAALSERTIFSKYNINPVRIKSLLMTRILEGYRARKYGQNTQDPDKVSIHMTLKLADCGVVLHYEVSFVSSPYHVPMVGTAHIKLELSGDDKDFIGLVKKTFITQHGQDSAIQGRLVSAFSKAAAERICKLLRWIRKEDYLDSYLCLPGWGDIDHFAKSSSFLRRIETLTMLQRHRHFRTEIVEVVAIKGGKHENHDRNYALFSDLMETHEGEENLFDAISDWSTGIIDEHKMYFKVVFPAKEDNLTYYVIIHVTRCHEASRLFKISIDFHGELDAEQRLGVLASFQDKLKMYSNIVVLPKSISDIIALRPESRISTWPPKLAEYFLHHKSWDIVRDAEVLPLITKRRNQVGNFIIIHSEDNRAVFAKFVDGDVVVYQVLDRQDGVYVDIHMECHRSMLNPFYKKESTFYEIYEKVKRKDMTCAKNLVSRTNLLKALDHRIGYESTGDILRLINISSQVERQLRFFHDATANELLFNLTSEFITTGLLNKAAKLLSGSVGEFCGDWFIMRVDWYVLSAILFSTKLMEGSNSSPYQQLIFFTSGITDLYPTDNDTTNSDAAHDDDPYGLDLVVNEIEQAHAKNYATALYQALRNQNSPISCIQGEDVTYALRSCFFKIVLREFISLDDLSGQLSPEAETMTGIKLFELIGTLLSPLPGSDDQVFYFNGNEILESDPSGEGSIEPTDLGSLNSHDLDDTNGRSSDQSRVSRHSNDGESDIQSHAGESVPVDVDPSADMSPLFFRIRLDGKTASQHHIRALKSSTTLEAQVSVFNNKKHLPQIHQSVISRLRRVLNSFAVEQSLEKYRFYGDALSEDDLKDIITILPQTKHHSFNIPLNFYASKCNCLVSASNPTGSTENDLDHAYSKLYSELGSCATRSSNNSFLIMEEPAPIKVFPFWCFVQINRQSGIVTITVYHPSGTEAAAAVGKRTCKLVISICHKTNQLLLLENLHRTKSASVLLIAEEQTSIMDDDSRNADHVQQTKHNDNEPFSCPVQYQKIMALNHRCAPMQAIDTISSSTLHNFLLSNRRGIFVYKDESENIFYMKLLEHQHSIELCVYGLFHPGPSITEQLVCLLQKNILSLGLNAISSLLMKNQHYNLLPADIAFLRGFSDEMGELEAENSDLVAKSRRVYALPSHIKDPLVILLLFRRNITGSTFIHHLHESTEETTVTKISDVLNEREDGGITLCIPPSEFTFYFNSSPSQLDPNYQALSTLTEKGRQFSRDAGSGIAIIEIGLSSDNVITVFDTPAFASVFPDRGLKVLGISKPDISLQRLQENERSSSFKITVDITNTTVDVDILHKWVELSLSQVLVAWSLESHMRLSQGTADENYGACEVKEELCAPVPKNQRLALWRVVPSLPAFEDMMRIAVELPHPACVWVKREKMMRATSLSSLTLQMTEMLMGILCQKARLNSFPGVSIIRCSQKASIVNIRRNPKVKNSVSIELNNGKKIKDKAIENPEYIVVFGLESYDQSLISTSQLFFKETLCLRPTQETSIFSQALTIIKNKWPSLFTRHLAFILRVSKSSRTLLAYNMHPQLWANIKGKFSDIDDEVSKFDETHRGNLQVKLSQKASPQAEKKRSINPQTTQSSAQRAVNSSDTVKRDKVIVKEEASAVPLGPKRRIPRPTAMLRPKLIGKSVEGSAMQAVTASRLRASSRPNPQRAVSGSGKSASVSSSALRDKERQKAKKRDPITKAKDATRASSSRVQPTSKLLRDLSVLIKIPSPNIARLKMNQSSIQNMFHNFLRLIPHKESEQKSIVARVLSSCYGNYIGSWSAEQLKSDNNEELGLSCFHHIINKFITKKFFHVAASSSRLDSVQPLSFVFVMKELVSCKRYKAAVLMQVSTAWDIRRSVYVLHCRAWLINSSYPSENGMSLRGYVRQKSVEREDAVLEALLDNFANQLNLESEVLNFAGRRLRNIAKKLQVSGNYSISTASLLRGIISRFHETLRIENLEYHLQRRFLCPTTFLQDLPVISYKQSTICAFLECNCKLYHLSECRGSGDPCFSGSLKVVGFVVHFFITWHETVESAFDIFILTETKGQRLDLYVGREGSPYAEKLSHVILFSTMKSIQDVLRKTAMDQRKLHLWRSFGAHYSSSVHAADVIEMIERSYKVDLNSIDQRVESLFCDSSNELQIPWQQFFPQINQSQQYAHCIKFSSEGSTHYVVYVKNQDIFLSFKQHNHPCTFEEFHVLVRDKHIADSIDLSSVVEKFISYVSKWIFQSCNPFNVT